jgi:hypothetical protein
MDLIKIFNNIYISNNCNNIKSDLNITNIINIDNTKQDLNNFDVLNVSSSNINYDLITIIKIYFIFYVHLLLKY